ncbi:MAG: RNA pyrophosphohydrolase [Gammaproteobacteria bacterium]|nr:MAG: RNA pyrophosphohydrolase [Gammaproteobacteria bacterium]
MGQDAWQFPQGGMDPDETPEEAMFRELREETGLLPHHVDVLGRTRDWMKYDLPEHLVRRHSQPVCVGQKQIWFLLQFRGMDKDVDLNQGDKPEFDDWCWVDYELPATQVVDFKQEVYRRSMDELRHLLRQLPC